MRMNGGIIGKLNNPGNYSANGVWKWSERYANILNNSFPTYYPGFDLSNIIAKQTQYTNKSFYISADSNPSSVFFKSDGTKMYVTGSTTDNVYQYSLSTAWSIPTASYDNIKFATAAQDNSPTGLFFKSDGTKMYLAGSATDNVYQYSLSTAWNVATATLDSGGYFNILAQDTTCGDIFFKSDGTKMYMTGQTSDKVFQYSLSSPWVISSASYDNISFSIGGQETASGGLHFKDDGTKMYIVGSTSDTIYQYSLSTAWNVATATVDSTTYNSLPIALQEGTSDGLFFKPDGTKLFLVGTTGRTVFEYNVGTSTSTAWNIQKYPGYNGISFSVAAQETTGEDIHFKPDGTKMYIIGSTNDKVQQYSLSTAWNVATAAYESNVSILAQTTACRGFTFKPDGTKMYVIDSTDVTYQYTLATPWSITTATYDSVSYDSGSISSPSIAFKPDGTKIYWGGTTITQYTASSAWSVATPTSDAKSYVITSGITDFTEATIQCFIISADGSKLWALGTDTDRIYQFNFGTSWEINTLTYSGKSYYIGDMDGSTSGIYFKPNGEKLFLLGYGNDIVYEINMT